MPRLVHLDRMPSRTRRPDPDSLPDWQPGKSGLRILRLLQRYRYLTSELAGMVYEHEHGKGGSQVRHHLTQLWRHGLVERFYRPAERGSTQYVYALSVDGAHLVLPDEEWSEQRRRIYNLARAKKDYEHLLVVSLLQVLWDLGSPEFSGTFRTVAYWLDKHRDADHVRNRFAVKLEGKTEAVKPDTTALVLLEERRFLRPLFFEIERTHKNYERTRRRFRVYDELLGPQQNVAAAVFKKEFGYGPMNGLAVFIGANDRHVASLRVSAWNALQLESRPKKRWPDFWFVALTDLFEEREGREEIIRPRELFARPIALNLSGQRGRLIV